MSVEYDAKCVIGFDCTESEYANADEDLMAKVQDYCNKRNKMPYNDFEPEVLGNMFTGDVYYRGISIDQSRLKEEGWPEMLKSLRQEVAELFDKPLDEVDLFIGVLVY